MSFVNSEGLPLGGSFDPVKPRASVWMLCSARWGREMLCFLCVRRFDPVVAVHETIAHLHLCSCCLNEYPTSCYLFRAPDWMRGCNVSSTSLVVYWDMPKHLNTKHTWSGNDGVLAFSCLSESDSVHVFIWLFMHSLPCSLGCLYQRGIALINRESRSDAWGWRGKGRVWGWDPKNRPTPAPADPSLAAPDPHALLRLSGGGRRSVGVSKSFHFILHGNTLKTDIQTKASWDVGVSVSYLLLLPQWRDLSSFSMTGWADARLFSEHYSFFVAETLVYVCDLVYLLLWALWE